MSKTEAKKIVRQYVRKLKEEKYPYSAVYLFGSYARGKPGKWSDIDVAVVSKKLKRNFWKNETKLAKLSLNIDSRIEPVGFTPEDFKINEDPMVYEIKKQESRWLKSVL